MSTAEPASPATDPPDRPLRSDARRNRARLVEAAQALMAERGFDTAMEDVAREAGVGVGTLYRHFPTKELLAEAVLAERLQGLAVLCRRGVASADPFAVLGELVRRGCLMQAADRLVSDVVCGDVDLTGDLAAAKAELYAAIADLAVAAQAAGQVRADVRADDLPHLIHAVGRTFGADDRERAERAAVVLLDGLRA